MSTKPSNSSLIRGRGLKETGGGGDPLYDQEGSLFGERDLLRVSVICTV